MCEIKYYSDDFVVDNQYYRKLVSRQEMLATKVSRKYSIYNTLITTFGLKKNEYSGIFTRVLTMKDLFAYWLDVIPEDNKSRPLWPAFAFLSTKSHLTLLFYACSTFVWQCHSFLILLIIGGNVVDTELCITCRKCDFLSVCVVEYSPPLKIKYVPCYGEKTTKRWN